MIPHDLNPMQRAAVENPPGPLLIVAGAGSGKTKTLTARLGYLLEQGVPPEHIVAITFTNKAAEEMKSRVKSRLPFVGTFHSFGARFLRAEAHNFDRAKNYVIYDADDSLSAIKKVVKSLGLPKKETLNPPALRRYISHIKSAFANPEDIVDGKKSEVLKAVYEEYELLLKKSNAFDFDDLIEKPVRLLREHPALLKKYAERYRYLLVDEFQDVNAAQYELVRLLGKGHRNVTVVGDDAQSIYKFRLADFKYFLDFERDWPETKTILLEENYRSTGNILAAANAVIGNNTRQKKKNLWTKGEAGAPLAVREHDDEVAEADWIASQITHGSRQSAIGHPQLAILYRTNAQSRAIEQSLIERGIPYRLFGGVRFYERKEIKDIVACLKYAANPKDQISRDRILKNFYAKPGRELVAELPQKGGFSPYELIAYSIKTSNYFEYLKKNFLNSEERVENIEELMGFAEKYKNADEFLEKITLLQSTDDENSNSQLSDVGGKLSQVGARAVLLMTIHIAKGLEFDNVIVAGCNEGLLPHQMSYTTPEEIEEERRLMYVAMTRARHELSLSFYHIGSRFLYEIPPELIVFSGTSGNAALPDEEERYIEYN